MALPISHFDDLNEGVISMVLPMSSFDDLNEGLILNEEPIILPEPKQRATGGSPGFEVSLSIDDTPDSIRNKIMAAFAEQNLRISKVY
jgi:hypothetical protein